MGITLVTAIVDISDRGPAGRRSIGWYLDAIEPVLTTRHSLVIHADPGLVEALRTRRGELAPDAATRIVPTRFDDLPTARWEPAIRAHLDAGRRPPTASNPVKDSAAYLALGWSKPALLAESVRADDGASDRYWWIDAHLTTVAVAPVPGPSVDELLASPRGPIHATILWETSSDEYEDRARFHRTNPFARVAAGLLSVTPDIAPVFAQTIDSEIDACLDGGWPATDECLLGIAVDRLRDRATLSWGPWESLLSDLDGLRTVPWHRLRLLRDCRQRDLDDRALGHALDLLELLDRSGGLRIDEEFLLHDELLVVAWRLDRRAELDRARDGLRRLLDLEPSLAGDDSGRVLGNLALADERLD